MESRGDRDTLAACGIDPNAHGNITFMPNTTDCRQFWSLTKIALMPSLWWENQPLVAIEAMINGIPVIGSDRGGTPETLGASGFALPLPARLTPTSQILPSADEVETWVESVIRLWDDDLLYQEQSALAKREAQRWHPDRLRPLYAEFFRNVRMQPGTPFVARTAAETARSAPALEPPRPAGERVAEGRVRGSASAETAESRNDRAEVCSARPGPAPAAPHPNPLPRERGEYLRGERGGISFVVCVSDDVVLKANLLASPGLVGPSSPHEVILIHRGEQPLALRATNMGLERARRANVLSSQHQDVLCSRGLGPGGLTEQSPREAERRFGPIGVAGVYGVGAAVGLQSKGYTLGAQRVGWVVDRGRTLQEAPELPARVATLDELLLVLRRDTPLRFDPALGFHMYGADICLQAAERGLAVVCLVHAASTELAERRAAQGVSSLPRRRLLASGSAPAASRDIMRHHRS